MRQLRAAAACRFRRRFSLSPLPIAARLEDRSAPSFLREGPCLLALAPPAGASDGFHRSGVLASMTVVIRLPTGLAREAGREATRTRSSKCSNRVTAASAFRSFWVLVVCPPVAGSASTEAARAAAQMPANRQRATIGHRSTRSIRFTLHRSTAALFLDNFISPPRRRLGRSLRPPRGWPAAFHPASRFVTAGPSDALDFVSGLVRRGRPHGGPSSRGTDGGAPHRTTRSAPPPGSTLQLAPGSMLLNARRQA